MTSQEEIDLKNHFIDEICLHPEIYDRHTGIFDGIAMLLGISSEYLFHIFHDTMQKTHVELI